MRHSLLCLFLLLPAVAGAQIRGGTYTLGSGAGNDFGSFEEAFETLEDLGIGGPVVIEVEQATYSGRLVLGRVPGVSSTNTVTFRGIESGGQQPLLQATPTVSEPYVLAVGANWVTFEALDFEVASSTPVAGSLLLIDADDVSVIGNSFDGDGMAAGVLVDVRANRANVQDNSFADGEIGVRVRADSGDRTTSGSVIQGNSFQDQTFASIRAEDQASSGTAVQILDNSTSQNGAPPPTSTTGIWVQDVQGDVEIWRNITRVRVGTSIRIENTDGGSEGVSVINHRSAGSFVYGRVDGIEVLGSSHVQLWNNTLHLLENANTAGDGAAISVDAASSDVQILNNILVNEDPDGLALDVEDGDSIRELDFNVYDQPQVPSRFAVQWEGMVYTDLAQFQRASAQAPDGIAWPVEFFGPTLQLSGRSDGDGRLIGRSLREVPEDFEGDARDLVRPYRGADEAATPLAAPPPYMGGTYTIGPGEDYDTFNDAVDDLDVRGVDSPVTFIVTGSLFFEQIDLQPIRGGSSANTVTFVGQVGTPQIKNNAFGSLFNYVLRLNSVENVTFRRLAFRSQSEDNADVVDMNGGENVTFDECVFIADSETRGTLLSISRRLVFDTDSGNPENVRVWNSTFSGGSRGIDVAPINEEAGGFELIGNEVVDLNPSASVGIRVGSNADGFVMRGNRVEVPGSPSGFVGIEIGAVNDATRDLVVEENEVLAEDGTGIYWEGGSASPFSPDTEIHLINNTVRMNGDDPATIGLHVFRSRDVLVAHNSVSMASTAPASAAAVYSNVNGPSWFGGPANLRNNVFQANAGRALVVDINSSSSNQIDGNALATGGTVLATYTYGSAFDGDCADLACVQGATGSTSNPQDLNSVEKTVAFVDAPNGDLRLADVMGADPEMAGLAIPEVATDFEGDGRPSTRPYRGADERLPSLSPYTISGGEGWRTLALPKAGLELGGEGPGGSRFTPGYLQPIYTAGYVGADRDQRNRRERANVFLFDETTGTFVVPERSESVGSGQGFWVYVSQDDDSFTDGVQGAFPKVLDASGGARVLGDFTFPVTYTSGSRTPGRNLVGNPYDEAIDWDDPNWVRTGMSNTVWVYDPAKNGGEYRTWNGLTGDLYDGVIGAGQGFHVLATQRGATLRVSPSAKLGWEGSVRSLTDTGRPGVESAGKAAPLGLTFRLAGEVHGEPRETHAFVSFSPEASLGVDLEDGHRLAGAPGARALRLYALVSDGHEGAGDALTIASLPETLSGPAEVLLHAEALSDGLPAEAEAVLNWDPARLPAGWTGALLDRQTGARYDLSESGSISLWLDARDGLSHSEADHPSARKALDPLAPPPVPEPRPLRVEAQKRDAARFALVLTPDPTASPAALAVEIGEIGPNPTRGSAALAVALVETGEVTVRVYDALGREVIDSRTTLSEGAHRLAVPVGSLAPGAYVVRVEAPGGAATRRLTVVR